MASEEITIQNFAAGELSPGMLGRYELPVAKSGCRRMRNFISETQGAGRYRSGFRYVHHTRLNRVPFLEDFQFNDEQAYVLEFTDKKLRFYKDEGIIVEANTVVTGITAASPGVITSNAHGYVTGDEIFLDDIVGMTELNGRSFLVVRINANTYSLTDIDGNAINTTAYTAYVSGGVGNRIYEIDTPYDALATLKKIKVTQNADVMYIDHELYEPRKLTRTGHASWTLSRYTRTADPFLSKKVITAFTAANPGVATSVAHGYVTGDEIIIEEVVGMTQLNSRPYTVVRLTADTYSLKDYFTGTAVDTSAYTAYVSDGFASKIDLLPSVPAFYEGRIYHGGMFGSPSQFIGSRSPSPTTGIPRYDDFTAGTDADHAVYSSIADGEVNYIRWLIPTNRFLMSGTFGTEVRITGESSDKPITPSSVNVRPENRLGVEDIAPINKENIVIYVQRGGLTLRSFEYDTLTDAFVSVDRNLVSDHVTKTALGQICWQSGRPDVVWGYTTDGRLLGLTFKSREDVSGWHPHDTGKSFGDGFIGVCMMSRPTSFDQLWVCTERVVGANTRRFIEFMTDKPEVPDFYDFYTSDEGLEDDREVFTRAMQQAQKDFMHLDAAISYDGSLLGSAAGATMTPSAVSGAAITLTASAAVFKASDVGRRIWKKSIDGIGYGRATITIVTDSTHATAQTTDAFDSTSAIPAGEWYMTTDEVTNLWHLEGREVSIVVDGSVHSAETVSGGSIALDYHGSVIHVGLSYIGYLEPMNVEGGGTTGPAQTKNRVVREVGIRFLNTIGAQVGTDLYNPEDVNFSEMPIQVGGPQLLFSGVKRVVLNGTWDTEKRVYVRQTNPMPCTVQLLELFMEADNE